MHILRKRVRKSSATEKTELKKETKSEDPLDGKNTEKILVIGCDVKIKGIASYEWEKIPEDLNFADFNKVIVNLYSIYLNNKKIENFRLHKFGNNLRDLIWNEKAEIIVIGRPLEIPISLYETVDCYSWLPNKIVVKEVKGNAISNISEEFGWYFKLVENWCFQFEKRYEESEFFEIYIMHALAENENGKPLGLMIKYKANEKAKLYTGDESAWIILLPPTTKGSVPDSVRIIIEKRYGFKISSEEPAWVEKYKLPSQKEMEEEIKIKEENIKEQTMQKDNLLHKLKKLKERNKLLYEKGHSLQESVLECISLLGAKLEEVPDKTKEDGRFEDPSGRKYLIEVKGSIGQLQRDDARELDDWIHHAETQENWKGKGMIIGNYLCDREIIDRTDIINPNEEDNLKRHEFCFLKTTQVFKALEFLEKDNFDQRNFWDKIHKSSGLADLPDIED